MADSLSPAKRSWNMSRIKSRDTTIEIMVRKYLFSQGFRYRTNVKNLPGKPDIVLPKYHTVIFVHGCFWHRHSGCKEAYTPKTRVEFWQEKFTTNVHNDILAKEQLIALGWKVLVVWECEIKKQFDETMCKLICEIKETTPCVIHLEGMKTNE